MNAHLVLFLRTERHVGGSTAGTARRPEGTAGPAGGHVVRRPAGSGPSRASRPASSWYSPPSCSASRSGYSSGGTH